MKTPELSQVLLSSVFIVDFEQVLHLFLVFLLLTLNMLLRYEKEEDNDYLLVQLLRDRL